MDVLIFPLIAGGLLLGVLKPHWALAVFAALLPVEALIPIAPFRNALLGASPMIALGGALLTGAAARMIARGEMGLKALFTDPPKLVLLLFIAWVFATAPAQSLGMNGGRNWMSTFLQLWVLLALTGVVLNSPRRHEIFMAVFASACLISALVAISRGSLAELRDVRVGGLASGPNAAARYFVAGMLFLFYLQSRVPRIWQRGLIAAGAAVLMGGVLFTQSRTGLLLAVSAVLLMPLVTSRARISRAILNVVVLALMLSVLLPTGSVQTARSWFAPEEIDASARLEGVSENVRIYFWQAGMKMLMEQPFTGVGIDRFPRLAPDYVLLPVYSRNPFPHLSTHSMYLSLLSETGVIGFGLFMLAVILCVRRAWRAHYDGSGVGPASVWLAALFLLLLGAHVKNDLGDKLLWLTLGAAASLAPAAAPARVVQRRIVTAPRTIVAPPRPARTPARFRVIRRPEGPARASSRHDS